MINNNDYHNLNARNSLEALLRARRRDRWVRGIERSWLGGISLGGVERRDSGK